MCFSFCACSKSPEERLPDEVEKYIFENVRVQKGYKTSTPINVDIAETVELKENQWAILGTYTVKLGDDVLSAKFGLVATYDEKSDKFTYSKEDFDEFK